MENVLAWIQERWWVFLLRGMLSLLVGALCIISPVESIASFVIIWAMFTFFDGIILLIGGLTGSSDGVDYDKSERWEMAAFGVLGILVGLIGCYSPLMTIAGGTLGLVVSMAVWMIVSGVFSMIYAVRTRSFANHFVWVLILSAISIVAGLYMISRPAIGALSLILTLGIYAIAAGVAWIIFAFRIRKALA